MTFETGSAEVNGFTGNFSRTLVDQEKLRIPDIGSSRRYATKIRIEDTTIQQPKTILVTAGFDPLVDEAEEFAFLLHENDNTVIQLHYPSLFHGFASMTRLKSAKLAVDDFLREYKEIL